jgi:hypothetical protein
MLISQLKPRSDADDNQLSTIRGVVRANYHQPFPHFTLEDESGTIICKPKDSLPKAGTHVELTGTLQTITPQNCTLAITFFCENDRTDVPHPNSTCELTICEFASSLAA